MTDCSKRILQYDLKIACFNSSEFIGNGFVLPAGPLRESIKEIKNYDMIFLNGSIKSTKKISATNKSLK